MKAIIKIFIKKKPRDEVKRPYEFSKIKYFMLISELLNSIQERYESSWKIINVCLVYKQGHLDSTIRFAETVKNLNHYLESPFYSSFERLNLENLDKRFTKPRTTR